MLKLTDHHKIKRFFSPISIAEIGSRITYRNRGRFHSIQKILKVIWDSCNSNMFRDPNSLLKRYLSKGTNGIQNEAENFLSILRLIIDSKDYDSLVKGQEWPHLNFRGKVNTRVIKDYRDRAETKWVKSLYRNVISILSPYYVKGDVSTYKISDSSLRRKTLRFLDSDEFKISIIRSLMKRCNILILRQTPISSEDFHCLKFIDGAFHFYKRIVRKMIETGFDPDKKKRKNDFNDFHLLFYLGLGNDYCFVSEETQFQDALVNSSQKEQVKKFKEFMDYLKSKPYP